MTKWDTPMWDPPITSKRFYTISLIIHRCIINRFILTTLSFRFQQYQNLFKFFHGSWKRTLWKFFFRDHGKILKYFNIDKNEMKVSLECYCLIAMVIQVTQCDMFFISCFWFLIKFDFRFGVELAGLGVQKSDFRQQFGNSRSAWPTNEIFKQLSWLQLW